MAVGAGAEWRVRSGGDDTNGGGFDPTLSGAGTDYTDQDSAQLTLTDLATADGTTTTLTSATGGFTSAMVGNCIKITSGTNFTTGYYFITAYTDTNTVTIDRSPATAAGSGGNGKLGGAFSHFDGVLDTSASGPGSPLVAGNVIWVRGAGSDTPSSSDFTCSTYRQYTAGNLTNGRIRWKGYNGRPRISVPGLTWYNISHHSWENLECLCTGNGNNAFGVMSGAYCQVRNCRFDQAGYDMPQVWVSKITDCEFLNSGGTTSASSATCLIRSYATTIRNCLFVDQRGPAITSGSDFVEFVNNNVIRSRNSTAAINITSDPQFGVCQIVGNIIHDSSGDAIKFATAGWIERFIVRENIITGSGGYGINCAGTTALNDACASQVDRNIYGSGTGIANSSGDLNNLSHGPNDETGVTDPYTDESTDDYTINSTAGGGQVIRDIEAAVGCYVA